jgi:hypothetical protein
LTVILETLAREAREILNEAMKLLRETAFEIGFLLAGFMGCSWFYEPGLVVEWLSFCFFA